MKIDRLLGMIIYLIKHEKASAAEMAAYFRVSVRTVQRDIETISLAGVPIYAIAGKKGGYAILPHFQLEEQGSNKSDQRLILSALESLSTAYSNTSLNELLTKYNAIAEEEGEQKVFWDFGVTKENGHVQQYNQLLEQAIMEKQYIRFRYRNAQGKVSEKWVEPLAIHYKWYAWYLFGYVPEKKDYRTFKVARIEALQKTNETYTTVHKEVKKLMAQSEQAYYQLCQPIEVHFKASSKGLMMEYFPDCPMKAVAPDTYQILINVPLRERLWKALLLSFGDEVEIIGPKAYKEELLRTAKRFIRHNEENG